MQMIDKCKRVMRARSHLAEPCEHSIYLNNDLRTRTFKWKRRCLSKRVRGNGCLWGYVAKDMVFIASGSVWGLVARTSGK